METIDDESSARNGRDKSQEIDFSVRDFKIALFDKIVAISINHFPFLHGSRQT